MGFFRGFFAPFRGAVFVARQKLWRYLVLPVILNVALGVASMVAAARYFREELVHMLDSAPVLGALFLFISTVVGGAVLFILIQPVLNAVFCDRLSEVVEKRVRGSAPSAPLLASTGRAIVHALLKLVLYGLALVVGLALTALTGVGSLVGVGLGAIFLAYDGFDYPLARRHATFGAKWRYLGRYPDQAIGYGIGATLLYLIPLAIFVAPAFTAVGATLAFLETETRAETRAQAKAARLAEKSAAKNGQKTDQALDSNSQAKDQAGEAAPSKNPIDLSAS